jgi:hypothetical protein
MGDVVSLNRARKAKAKADRAVQAEANRVAFGRTKAEKAADAQAAARREALLDGAKREE